MTAPGAWVRVLDASSTRAELDAAIDQYARVALIDALEQIDALDLTERDRIAALVSIAPVIRGSVACALTSAWEQLRAWALS